MPKPATLQALATKLGLSKATISVALNGKPGVSDEVRARILAEAKRSGYRPNPVAAELMALVRANRQRKSHDTIAFINTFREDPLLMKRVATFRRFVEGATEQAGLAGYQLEEFRVGDRGMTPARLDQILKARGIRGVLLGPRWFDEPELAIDWAAYSCVLLGETTYGAGISRVCNHHPHTSELALVRMAALGYKRVGIELISNYEAVRHFDFLAGVEPAQRTVGNAAHFFARVLPRDDDPEFANASPEKKDQMFRSHTNQLAFARLKAWTREEDLDAVITLGGYAVEDVRGIKTSRGLPLGYARLDVAPGDGLAGVNQHGQEIGRTAVDLLRGLLHSGERGVAPRPRILLVEGEWVDGATAPAINA